MAFYQCFVKFRKLCKPVELQLDASSVCLCLLQRVVYNFRSFNSTLFRGTHLSDAHVDLSTVFFLEEKEKDEVNPSMLKPAL